MILRRKCLRIRTPKKSKVFPNKIKSRRKKTPKKFNQLVEFPKAIDILQNSVKKNMLPKIKKKINIVKYQLPKVSLNAEKYRLRNSSCLMDDLLFLTSTPNKSSRENKKYKTLGSKDSSHVKTSNPSVSNQRKSEDIFIKVSHVQEKKKGFSISPIPLIQKGPNLRKRKKSASVSSKNLANGQTVPLNKKRKSLPSEKDSSRKSPVKTRNRTSLSRSSLFENSLQKKSASFSKNCCENSSTIREKKKLSSPLKRVRKNGISHYADCSLTEDTIPNKTNLTSSKSCSRKSFQEKDSNKSNSTSSKSCSFQENKKKYHSSKTKRNTKKTEEPKKLNKTKHPYVYLKRLSPRLLLKRDDLNISSKNSTKKNVDSNKQSSSFDGNQFEKSRKNHRIKENIFKTCDQTLDISTPKTSTRSSMIQDISSKKSFCNISNEKENNFTKIIREKNVGRKVRPNSTISNHSRTRSKVQQKRRYSVPEVKKKNSLGNFRNSKSSNKAAKSSAKLTSKISTIPICDKDYNGKSIPVDDLITASFVTPNTYINSQIKKRNESEITSTPLNKKTLLKLKNKPDDLSCQELKVFKKGLPAKGTLKRKRYIINALKEKSEGYEDDIFESSKFHKFKETMFMDDDSDTSGMSIVTPKCAFLVTPRMPEKTPRYKDCFSPMELMKARKVAEEYIYRRNKRKLQGSSLSESSLQERNANQQNERSAIEDPEKKKLDFISFAKSLKEKEDKSADSDEDVYFSDASS